MPEKELHNEKDLLARIAEGDEEAFKELHIHYEQKIYSSAYAVLKSAASAKDAAQEIFIKIWVNREKLRDMDYFRPWLNTISRNYLYNKLRQKAQEEIYLKHLVQEGFESYSERTYDEAEIKELTDLVKEAINKLSARQRAVFEMSRQEGLKHREIADKLNISQETVKKHITEALRHIRQYLQAYGKHISIILLLYLTR